MTTPLLVKGPLRHWRTRDGTARGPIASKRTFSVLFGLFRHSAIFQPEPCPGPVMQTNSEKHQATRRVTLLSVAVNCVLGVAKIIVDRKSTRLNSSHVRISYAVF